MGGDPQQMTRTISALLGGSQSQIAPSLSFSSVDEGSTVQPNANTPFGAQIYHPNTQAGLVGLDPRYVQDPRFNYSAGIIPQGAREGRLGISKPGELPITTRIGNPVSFIPDLDDKTVANDMWAVTLGGKTGTSPGDEADPVFVSAAKQIVGDSRQITPNHVAQMKQFMLDMRYPDFRQRHPGPGWTPLTDPNAPPNPTEND